METDSPEVHIDDRTLNRLADGEVPEGSFEPVRSHLRSCAICSREILFVRALSAAICDLPTPKPPAGLIDHLFPERPNVVKVLPLPARPRRRARAPRLARLRSLFAFALAAGAAVVAIALSSDRAMAGSSTLILDRTDNRGADPQLRDGVGVGGGTEPPGADPLLDSGSAPVHPDRSGRQRYRSPSDRRWEIRGRGPSSPGYGLCRSRGRGPDRRPYRFQSRRVLGVLGEGSAGSPDAQCSPLPDACYRDPQPLQGYRGNGASAVGVP